MRIMLEQRILMALLVLSAHGALLAKESELNGLSLSYTHLVAGEIKLGGQTTTHDVGTRYAIHLREYATNVETHRPFIEIGFFYQEQKTKATHLHIDNEVMSGVLAFGSDIPLWMMPDRSVAAGLTPELAFTLGQFTADVTSSSGGTSQQSADDALSYGIGVGLTGWLAFEQSFYLNAGVVAQYWLVERMTVIMPTGTGFESQSTKPSGWDVGVRAALGFVF